LAGTVHPIPDAAGHITRMAIFGRDVTRERRAVAALEQNEQRLRDIVSSLHDAALVVYDRKGVCQSITIDPAIDGIVMLRSADSVGMSIFQILPPDAAARRMALIEAAFAHGQGGRDEYSTPSGHVFDASVAPMRGANGDVIAVVCFVLDITKRKRAEEALRQAHNQLMTAREQERQALSRELHDSLGQGLVVLDMAIKNTISHCRKECPDAPKFLNQAARQCDALIKEVRAISHGLYPATLESLGLGASLRQLAHDCAGPMLVEVHCDELDQTRLPPQVEIALYRIAQEAMKNAIRHSNAKHLDIRVGCQGGDALMQICDNGTGFDPASLPQTGIGLENMKARAQAVDGQLTIDSHPGCTRIVARVPRSL
jgi:PAS domain S-box-containing protein